MAAQPVCAEEDIDDAVQEAYVRLLRAREAGRIASPKAYLFTVARNIALDRHRHRQVIGAEPLAESERRASH